MADYRFLTIWRIKAPQQEVFDLISDSLRWPEWWPGADSVEEIRAGDATGIGSVRRYTWKGTLPYRLRFDALATCAEVPHRLEASVSGDLEGHGRWTFTQQDGVTTVRYEWQVRTNRWWMNLATPAARPMFTRNHHLMMKQAEPGLVRLLGSPLLASEYREQSLPAGSMPRPLYWSAAAIAGVIAGVIATIVQMGLWKAASYPAMEMLLRDTRLAAAILMGTRILPPPVSFDWRIMLAASVVHFALSAVYGLLIAAPTTRLRLLPALMTGGVLGLLLYAINMYGFTALFPWFQANRDWITAAAHATFGITTVIAYNYKDLFTQRGRKEHSLQQQAHSPRKTSKRG